MAETHPEIGRNEFDEWCWRRGYELRDVVDGLALAAAEIRRECGRDLKPPSIETVRLIRLPFSDARRRVPGPQVMELIQRFTGGATIPAHFYPPQQRGVPAVKTAGAGAR